MRINNTTQQSFGTYAIKIPSEIGTRRLNLLEKKFGNAANRVFTPESRNYFFENDEVAKDVLGYLKRNEIKHRGEDFPFSMGNWDVKRFVNAPFDLPEATKKAPKEYKTKFGQIMSAIFLKNT